MILKCFLRNLFPKQFQALDGNLVLDDGFKHVRTNSTRIP
jgi:hypothetical protein